MSIQIKDLDNIISENPHNVKIADYTVDLNNIPLGVAIEINNIVKNCSANPDLESEDRVLEKIIYPIIAKENIGVEFNQEFKEKFSYKKVVVFWQEILTFMYPLAINSEENQKKTKQP